MADTPSSTSDSSSISDNPTSKCSEKPKIADNIDEDVISSLPDEILCHILSFFPTKLAVATSVLSKRWKLLWTSIPNLDFSFDGSPVVNQSNFMNFVDKVLSLNNVVRVRKVYLLCTDDCDSSRVKAWINAIVGRDTKDFSLCLPMWCCVKSLNQISGMISLPDSFFIRENLVELRLYYIPLKVPSSVYFPNVKTILLKELQFLDDDSMKNLLAGCPVLEKLSLERSGAWDNAQTLYICSSSLSYLNLYTEEYCDNKNSGNKVVIEAPNLRSLCLTDFVIVDYDMNNISSLVEAYVDFESDNRVAWNGGTYKERLYELFRKISHIKDLSLSISTMDILGCTFYETLPMFNNLTILKVEILSNSWPILLYLFNCSPNLVTFNLIMEYVHPDFEWYEPEQVPQCLLSSLENIVITGFSGCDSEMEMVYYFLNNAMVLKKMTINFTGSPCTWQVEYGPLFFKATLYWEEEWLQRNGSFGEAKENHVNEGDRNGNISGDRDEEVGVQQG